MQKLSVVLLFLGLAVIEIKSERRIIKPESSQLCPQVPGEVYRYHNKTQKCYKVGSKGPCGEMMIFYADPTDADQGECDCDNQQRCHRPLIYWPQKDRCYFAFEQGPCKPRNWLAFDIRSSPDCRANPCKTNMTAAAQEFEDDDTAKDFWIQSYGGECVKTNTQGFCHYPNEVVAINGFAKKVKPFCTVIETDCSLPTVPSLFCAPGQKWAIDGMCSIACKKRKRHRHHSRPRVIHWQWRHRNFRNSRRNHHHHDETDSTTELPAVQVSDESTSSSSHEHQHDIEDGLNTYIPREVPAQNPEEEDDYFDEDQNAIQIEIETTTTPKATTALPSEMRGQGKANGRRLNRASQIGQYHRRS